LDNNLLIFRDETTSKCAVLSIILYGQYDVTHSVIYPGHLPFLFNNYTFVI